MESNLLGTGAAASLLISFSFINLVLAFGTKNSRWIEDHTRAAVRLVRIHYLFMGAAWLLMALRYWNDNPLLTIGFNITGLSGMIIFVYANYKLRNATFGKRNALVYAAFFSVAIWIYLHDLSFPARTHAANIILTVLLFDLIRLYWKVARNSPNRAYRLICLFAFISLISSWGRSFVLIMGAEGSDIAWHILNATAPAFSLILAILLLLASIWETHYELVHYATYDDLTGVLNRRAFKQMFETLEEQARQKKESYGLVLIDLDLFKNINDTYGHDVGDFVLKEVASLLKDSVRSDDRVSRIGGEEFSILLPKTNKEAVEQMCERLKETVKNHVFKSGQHEIKITLSIGAGIYRGELGFDQSFKLVDDALYAAKVDRNTIRFASS